MTLTKEQFLKLSEKAHIKEETLTEIRSRLGDIFSKEKFPKENDIPRYAGVVGDSFIEPNLKYKNYYKKVFNPKQIGSPFTAAQIIENSNRRIWIYLDQNDKF